MTDEGGTLQLSAKDVVDNNAVAIQKASQSYQTDTILTGYLRPLSSQLWEANWILIKNGQIVRWQFHTTSVKSILRKVKQPASDTLVNNG